MDEEEDVRADPATDEGPETAPHDTAPEDTAPEGTAPHDTAPDDTAPDDSAPDEGGRMSRGRLAVLISTVVVAVAVLAFLAVRPRDEQPAAAPILTTTTTVTTTTAAPWPATQAMVATAKVPTILVRSAPPPEWESATPVKVWDNPPPVASQATTPARPALPRMDFAIQGRYADAAGWTFSNPTSFKDPFVMLVTEQRGDWLKVLVPVRPNGTEGWVPVSDVDLSNHTYRIDLRLGERMLRLYDGQELVVETPVVVGKDDTHTPTGRFYVTDSVPQSNPAGAYGPLALPISAYSEQIDEFDNGVPVIAMHGTNKPELLGQNVSNGCIRMPNDMVTKIGETIPLGTPIDISA